MHIDYIIVISRNQQNTQCYMTNTNFLYRILTNYNTNANVIIIVPRNYSFCTTSRLIVFISLIILVQKLQIINM